MLARIALFVCLASVAVGDLANQPTHKFNAFSRAVDWTLGGSAQFVAHALRLTPDSPSRSGFVFSRRPVASDDKEWAIDLEFRIFGQGVTLFGDGIALWLTREQFKPGRLFGHSERWKGYGILFDTYDNTGTSSLTYPYISLLKNDGTKIMLHETLADPSQPTVGCTSRIRQLGGVDNLQVIAARLHYKDRTLSLKLLFGEEGDFRTKSTYDWQHCFEVPDVDMPPGYYIGVTASTGDLSDVHEIVSFQFSPSAPLVPDIAAAVAEESVEEASKRRADTEAMPPLSPPPEDVQPPPVPVPAVPQGVPVSDIVADERVVALINEHAAVSRESLRIIHSQLNERISQLHSHLQQMLDAISRTEVSIQERLDAVEARIDERVAVVKAESDIAASSSTAWIIPFAILMCLLAVATVWGCMKYRQLKKTHML